MKPDAHPVQAKPRRYPPEKRQLLRSYVEQLENLGLMKPAERTEWVSLPLLFQESLP